MNTENQKHKYFGTDGFRGEAGRSLTSMQAYKVGRFLGWYYSSKAEKPGYRPRVVIGKDTRLSGYMLEYSIASGLTASGADVYMLHVITTPGVSYVTRQDEFDCGIMITASHNPYLDNGIKIINRHGEKTDDRTTELIEAYLDGDMKAAGISGEDIPLAHGDKIGRITDYISGRNRYVGYLISLASNSYKNLNIGLDCGNGASWAIAQSVFGALGARTAVMGAEPDGININNGCGSTHIEKLCEKVRKLRLDAGFAFDGDGDRCIAVDECGNAVDGDAIMYILANRLKKRGMLNHSTVVSTVMSNSGFAGSLKEIGIECIQTNVGDRFVYDCMQKNNFSIGGEQSGHIILKKYATTGDGLLTAIMICEEICDSKLSLKELAKPVKLYPQYLENVRVTNKIDAISSPEVQSEVSEIERLIGGKGRILLRESGTEPVIRVMTECESYEDCVRYAKRIAYAILKGGTGHEPMH